MLPFIALAHFAHAETIHHIYTIENPLVVPVAIEFNGIVSRSIRVDGTIDAIKLPKKHRDRNGECTDDGVSINIFEANPGSIWIGIHFKGWTKISEGQCHINLSDGSIIHLPYKVETKSD